MQEEGKEIKSREGSKAAEASVRLPQTVERDAATLVHLN